MKESEEFAIRKRLEQEEAGRDRNKFAYTYDALPHLMTWNESNEDIAQVVEEKVDYDSLPSDSENELYKGMAFKDQEIIVQANEGAKPLCEALGMKSCKLEKCPLFITAGTKGAGGETTFQASICREFKLAFQKQSSLK